MGSIRVGISGWRYEPWRGKFYPAGLAHRRELEFASRTFDTIEINGTFYSLQRPTCFHQWYADTPRGFSFAVKGGRFITHMKQLKDVEKPLANFFAQGVLALEEKLGPILWQFAERFHWHPQKVRTFLELLPKDSVAAHALACRHDARLEGRAWLEPPKKKRRVRHAFEVRHESFMNDEFLGLLEEHNVALVVSDGGPRWPIFDHSTARFAYVRLHGDEELYVSRYRDKVLDRWAERVERWHQGGKRDVFVYFDNDAKVHAPFDAKRLVQRLSGVTELRRPAPGRSRRVARTGTLA